MKHLSLEKFKEIMDNAFDEINIWDKDMRMLYINKTSYRHYGLPPEYFIGKTMSELREREKLWDPSSLPYVIREKKPLMQSQRFFLGFNCLTISVPILDDKGDVEYVIQTCREDIGSIYKDLSVSPVVKDSQIGTGDIVFKSHQMEDLMRYAERLAYIKAPLMILGETGTGKSMIAKYIHKSGDRSKQPFVTVNVSSISPSLFESEFFGYARGSFTGAEKSGKEGFIAAADGGILFLDEIGELPYEMQSKLLYVLQEEEYTPIGANKPRKVDVRFISATNQNLKSMVEAGRFRADLYHRLNVLELEVPPLRNRPEDITVLTSYFLNMFNAKYNKVVSLSDAAMTIIRKSPWLGNVRELSNVLERSVISADSGIITPNELPHYLFEMNANSNAVSISNRLHLYDAIEELERQYTIDAYNELKTTRKVAERLGVSQTKAQKLITKYVKSSE